MTETISPPGRVEVFTFGEPTPVLDTRGIFE